MITNLLEAPLIHSLQIIQIDDYKIKTRLESCGVFVGDIIAKEERETQYSSMKIRLEKGHMIIPGKLARHVHIMIDQDTPADFHLSDLPEGLSATITMIEKDQHALHQFEKLGLKKNRQLTLLKKLPHMEYRLLVDSKRRIRITEAIAAGVFGKNGKKVIQLSFSTRNKPFAIIELAHEKKMCEFLIKNGIEPGKEIILEGIENGKTITLDEQIEMVIYASNGSELLISNETAKNILVQEL